MALEEEAEARAPLSFRRAAGAEGYPMTPMLRRAAGAEARVQRSFWRALGQTGPTSRNQAGRGFVAQRLSRTRQETVGAEPTRRRLKTK